MGRRVVAIAMEAAEMTLIEKWVEKGLLPTFSHMISEGSWRKLKSTADVASGGTWPTLHTGCSPASHGIARSHRHLKTGTYEIHKQYADQVKQGTFWDHLSEQGFRCAIIDVPKSFPKSNFNGIHLVNWGDEHQTWKQSSWPHAFIDEVIAKFGKHPLEGWYQQRPKSLEGYKKFSRDLLSGIALRTELALDVLDKEAWDLFMISYSELHWAGHIIWHTMDKDHPEYSESLSVEIGDVMFECYKAIDDALSKIRIKAPDAVMFVFANSGMGPNYSGRHLLTKILQSIGYAPQSKQENGLLQWIPARKWGAQTFEHVEKYVPIAWIEKAKAVIPERIWDKYTRKLLYGGNNWKDCIAFSIPSDYSGAIRINLKGREPQGKVSEGAEYDEVCAKIIETFTNLVDPISKKTVVKEAIKVRDHFQGPYINELPDIVITWERNGPISAVISEETGLIEGFLKDKRTGGHESYGFLLISDGKNEIAKSNDMTHIMDIVPSIMNILGAEIPETMEGIILEEFADLHT